MVLVIDVGNTSSVFALFDEGGMVRSWRVPTGELADKKASLFKNLEDVHAIIISSVVPHVNDIFVQAAPAAPIFVSHEMLDLPIRVPKAQEVGADRLVNAIAVRAFYPSLPAIVIDFGTATTFDVLDGQGAYRGGAIAPGVHLSIETLHKAAAQLPLVELKKPAKTCGTSTIEAMQSGLYWGYIDLVEGLVKRLSVDLERAPFVIATGGFAHLFSENTNVIDKVDEELTLRGLYRIYQDTIHDKAEA